MYKLSFKKKWNQEGSYFKQTGGQIQTSTLLNETILFKNIRLLYTIQILDTLCILLDI